MKVKALIIILIYGTIAFGCERSGKKSISTEHEPIIDEESLNGNYCAEVSYYNPNTGTKNEYVLEVEVEDGELTKILWPNGGWLDNDHFSPEELDEDGWCEIETDRGIEHEIQIIEEDCDFSREYRVREDLDLDNHRMEREYLSGEEKWEYDEMNGLEGYFDESEYEED